MRISPWLWRAFSGAGLMAALCLVGDLRADEDAPPEKKKPTVIQLDLDNLPPDVAKRLLEIANKGSAKKKGQPAEEKKSPEAKAKKKSRPAEEKKGPEAKGPK